MDCLKPEDMLGAFDKLTPEQKEYLHCLHACFTYRNGVRHPDGSRGEIKITPLQMLNLLAYTLLNSKE